MKKLLSLLTLLLCVVGGVNAEDLSVTWTMGENTTGVAAPVTGATGIGYTVGSGLKENGTSLFDGKTYSKFDQNTGDEKGNNNHDNSVSLKKYVDFTFTPAGGNFTPTSVSFDIVKNGTGDPTVFVDFIDGSGTTIAVADNKEIIRNNAAAGTSTSHSYTVTGASSSDKAVTLRIIVGKLASSKSVGIANVVISGTMISSDAPVFSSSSDALALAVNPISTTKSATFTLSGRNLTDGTYNLTVPTVDGLSVLPTSFTVTNGACSQEFTVTYTSTADVAEAVANITATVDGITSTVAVTYSSVANLFTQTAITGATTWDWSKYGVKEINTNGTEFYREEILVANVSFYGFDNPADAFGPAQALTLNGDYIVRDSKYCQITSAKFTTTVPGMLKVVFSNTGGNRPYRYLYVNGKDTGVGSNSGTAVTASNIYVPAGDVELTAIVDPNADETYNPGSSSFMRINSIEFTTLPENTTVKIDNGTGYRTFTSKYPTDWSLVNGVSAYTASVSGNTVSFTKVTGAVPAGEGLLLKADDATVTEAYTVPIPTETPAAVTNALIGVTKETEVSDIGIFVLLNGGQGIGFYKTTQPFTVGANTAYLPGETAPARTFIGFESGEMTGIEGIAQSASAIGNYVDLQGRHVAQPTKGLYIVNGKKVVIK